MKQMKRAIGISAIILQAMVANASNAGEVEIGGVKITMPPPIGYCQLMDEQPADHWFLAGIRKLDAGQFVLLAVYAECEKSKQWEPGKSRIAFQAVVEKTQCG